MMPRAIKMPSILLFLCLACLTSCSDTTKYQAEMRGAWKLQTRKIPSEQVVLEAPVLSGQIEWFPISKNQAHVFVSVATEKDGIKVTNGIYTLTNDAFTLDSHLRIGGAFASSPIESSFETTPRRSTGKITSDDARKTLLHDDGTRFEFIGAQLTVTHPNGVEDVWKRIRDQKGALAN